MCRSIGQRQLLQMQHSAAHGEARLLLSAFCGKILRSGGSPVLWCVSPSPTDIASLAWHADVL